MPSSRLYGQQIHAADVEMTLQRIHYVYYKEMQIFNNILNYIIVILFSLKLRSKVA